MNETVHLIAKLKGVHLCEHELGQEILVVFSIVGKIRWIPCTHLQEHEIMYKTTKKSTRRSVLGSLVETAEAVESVLRQ